MNPTGAGILLIATLVIALALVYVPFGNYMHHVVTGRKHSRVERVIYKLIGVNPEGGQPWGVYARSVLRPPD